MDVPRAVKVKTRFAKIMALFLIALITTSVSAQSSETEHQFINKLKSILELDFDDEDALQEAVAYEYLQCAAFYNAVSIAASESSRPATADLYTEMKNWHVIVGQALLTEDGMPLSSQSTFVNAYVDTYELNSVLEYSEADVDFMRDWCSSDSMQDYGKEIISALEKNLEQAEE